MHGKVLKYVGMYIQYTLEARKFRERKTSLSFTNGFRYSRFDAKGYHTAFRNN